MRVSDFEKPFCPSAEPIRAQAPTASAALGMSKPEPVAFTETDAIQEQAQELERIARKLLVGLGCFFLFLIAVGIARTVVGEGQGCSAYDGLAAPLGCGGSTSSTQGAQDRYEVGE